MFFEALNEINLPIAELILGGTDHWEIAGVNEAVFELTGYSASALIGREPAELFAEPELARLETALERAEDGEKPEALELSLKKANGENLWVSVGLRFYKRINVTAYVAVTLTSIEKQKKLERQNDLLVSQYHLVQEMTGEVPFELDVQKWLVLVDESFSKYKTDFGDEPREDHYIPFAESLKRIHPRDREAYEQTIQKAAAGPTTGINEARINVADAEAPADFRWFRLIYKSIPDENGRIIRIIGRSYNIDKDHSTREAAKLDYLTHFLNKGETIKAIDCELSGNKGQSHVLMVIDIDSFKSINDTFGHTFGDSVISDVASIIRTVLPADAILGRVGGDEFVVLLKNFSASRAEGKAQELCDSLAKDYSGDGVTRHISASIGLAEFGVNGDDYESLFAQADRAMYRVKQSGKNHFRMANLNDLGPIETRVKENEIRININQNDQEFMMYAVSLMTHARNIDGSLNMLLKRMASEFQLDHIILFEDTDNQSDMLLTNYYSDKLSFYDKSTFRRNDELLSMVDGQHMVMYRKDELPGDNLVADLFKDNRMDLPLFFSVAIGRYDFAGDHSGHLYYISEREEFDWSDSRYAMLMELSRMIAIFVSLRFRMQESKNEIRHIQRRDQLTGLYNFEAFKAKAQAQIEKSEGAYMFALEYVDINNFGYINENYGYKVGDTVLKSFADDIKSQSIYVTGSRLYSDFFLILYRGEDEESLLREIRAQHKRFANMENYQYPSSGIGTCSGIYLIGRDSPDMDVAFENATLAWKQEKNSASRDVCLFTPALRQEKVREQQVLGEFYESLYRDDFCVYLQPKFKLGSHEVYAAEALVRWKKPNGEILAPGAFLPPLERIGYVTELDFYVFEEVLRALTRWDKAGCKPIVVSSNFSGRHFENGGKDFINRIKLMLSKYPVDPRLIEIEITESVLLKEQANVYDCLNELKNYGFRIAIDDFGTGYSSLSILDESPADCVKMDKSFIDQELTPRRCELLTEYRRLMEVAGKETIFEGIETEDQERILMNCGYQYGQGYLVNRPIPLAEFEKLYL